MSAKDPTLHTLDRFTDPDLWEVRDAVPIFDEHEERDQAGAIVRSFDLAALEEIASNCNRREIETGDAVPITLGHTVAGAAETDQPPIVGYARQFRVGKFGPQKKTGILATFYFFKDRFTEAMGYPRRSVELWIRDKIIDPIALLKRTPKRDLGLLTYEQQHGRLLYAMDQPDEPMVVCEPNPDDVPHPHPDYGDGDHEAMDGVMRYMGRHPVFRYAHKCYQESLKYNATAGYPAGGNTFMPGMEKLLMSKEPEKKEPEKKEDKTPPSDDTQRVQQTQHEIELARYQRESEALKQVNEAMQQRLAALERETRVARYERDLGHLISQGYQMDLAEELKEVEGYTAEQFGRHVERIKKRYQRAPVGKELLALAGKGGEGTKVEDEELTKEQAQRAVSMATREGSEFFGKYEEAKKFVKAN